MGASFSKASVNSCLTAVQTITNNSVETVNSDCANGVNSVQNINIGKIVDSNDNTFTNESNIAANLICAQESTSSSDFENAITAGLTADLTAGSSAGVSLGLSISESDISSFSSAISNVANSFDITTYQECVNSVLVEQNFTVSDGIYGSNSNTVLNSSIVDASANCNQKNTSLVTAQTDLAAQLATTAKSTSSAGFSLGSIGIIVLVLILLLFGGFKFITKGAGSVVKGTAKVAGGAVKGTANAVGSIAKGTLNATESIANSGANLFRQ